MGRTISWSIRDTVGCIRRGQMPLSQIPKVLQSFEKDAAKEMKKTGADHVLYAVKIYGVDGQLATVQFYMNPMSDEEFYKITGKVRGAIIYALHNHNRRW